MPPPSLLRIFSSFPPLISPPFRSHLHRHPRLNRRQLLPFCLHRHCLPPPVVFSSILPPPRLPLIRIQSRCRLPCLLPPPVPPLPIGSTASAPRLPRRHLPPSIYVPSHPDPVAPPPPMSVAAASSSLPHRLHCLNPSPSPSPPSPSSSSPHSPQAGSYPLLPIVDATLQPPPSSRPSSPHSPQAGSYSLLHRFSVRLGLFTARQCRQERGREGGGQDGEEKMGKTRRMEVAMKKSTGKLFKH